MAERFTKHLREKVTGIWEAQHQHPFVRGIGDERWTRSDSSSGCDRITSS